MVEINGLDGTAGQVPTLLPSACCQLRSVRKYQAGREGSALHGCLEMIDIFMVKLGFLGSSIPPRGMFLGSGLLARVRHNAAHGRSATRQGPGCTPTSRSCTSCGVWAPTAAVHSSTHCSTAQQQHQHSSTPLPHAAPASLVETAGWVGWTLKINESESKSSRAPKAQITHGSLSTSMGRDLLVRCLQGAVTGPGDLSQERALIKQAAETTCGFLNRPRNNLSSQF